MDEMNTPRRGGADHVRADQTRSPDQTQPLYFGARPQGAGPRDGAGSDRSRRFGRGARWTAAVVAAVVIAIAGASLLGVSLASGGSASAASPQAASAALTTNAAVQVAAASASGTGHPASFRAAGAGGVRTAGARACVRSALRLRVAGRSYAARARFRACLRRYPRLRFLLRLRAIVRHSEHGQVTFGTKQGPRTLVFERGIVQSASSGSVVVKAANGTVVTWDVTSSTILTNGGQRVAASALKPGRAAVLVGLVSGGANSARRIFLMS